MHTRKKLHLHMRVYLLVAASCSVFIFSLTEASKFPSLAIVIYNGGHSSPIISLSSGSCSCVFSHGSGQKLAHWSAVVLVLLSLDSISTSG